jgi:phosphoglycerate kinase
LIREDHQNGELDLAGKRVLIREDLNVPIKRRRREQRCADPRGAADHPRGARSEGARARDVASRPARGGQVREEFSLAPVAKRLAELLGVPVALKRDWLDGRRRGSGRGRAARERALQQGREKGLRRARGRWRRSATSTSWTPSARRTAPRRAPTASRNTRRSPAPGPLLVSELTALETALEKPARPLIAIVAGSKVSTKLTVLESLLAKVDQLIVGGGITNTFLAALGFNVGKSLYEPDMLDIASGCWIRRSNAASRFPMPTDVVVAKEFSATAEADVKPVGQVSPTTR